MRLRAIPVPRWPPAPPWAIAIIAVWLGLLLAVRFIDARTGRSTTICALKRLTGYPCPTCGGTRAADAALRGHLSEAFYLNPLLCLVVVGAGCWIGARLILGRRVSIELNRRERAGAWILAIAAVAANWAYVLWCGR